VATKIAARRSELQGKQFYLVPYEISCVFCK